MKVHSSKVCCLLVSRFRTLLLSHGDLLYGNPVLATSDALTILGALFNIKITFERNFRSLVSLISRKLGFSERLAPIFVMRPSLPAASVFVLFLNLSTVHRGGLQLPLVICTSLTEMCVPLISSAMDRSRTTVTSSSLRRSDPFHPLHRSLPAPHATSNLHSLSLQSIRCRTSQFQRCFLLHVFDLERIERGFLYCQGRSLFFGERQTGSLCSNLFVFVLLLLYSSCFSPVIHICIYIYILIISFICHAFLMVYFVNCYI